MIDWIAAACAAESFTVKANGAEDEEGRLFESPAYDATRSYAPGLSDTEVSNIVEPTALLELVAVADATAVLPCLKSTLPLGANPVTLVLKLTGVPDTAGLAPAETDDVEDAAGFTVKVSGAGDDEGRLFESPVYEARRLYVPALSGTEVWNIVELVALLEFVAVADATTVLPCLKSTLPEGANPITVARRVTGGPAVTGMGAAEIPDVDEATGVQVTATALEVATTAPEFTISAKRA
jgi:hypothetical protein